MVQYADDVQRVTKYRRKRASYYRGTCWMDCLWSKVVCSLTSCSTLTQCLQVLTDDGSGLVGRLIDPACIPDTDVALLNGAVQEIHLATLPLDHHHFWTAKVKGYKEACDFYGLAPSLHTAEKTEKTVEVPAWASLSGAILKKWNGIAMTFCFKWLCFGVVILSWRRSWSLSTSCFQKHADEIIFGLNGITLTIFHTKFIWVHYMTLNGSYGSAYFEKTRFC